MEEELKNGGNYMKKKFIFPTITLAIMMSQIVGCASASSSELISMLDNNQSIEIEIAEPVFNEQGVVVNSTWTELDQRTDYSEFRKEFDYDAQVQNQEGNHKNGPVYVDLQGNWTGNSTMYYAFMNQYFVEKIWSDTNVTDPIKEAIRSTYSDLSDSEEKLAALNAYFGLLDDAEPNYFNGGSTLTRAEFMEAFAKSFTPVDITLQASADFNSAVNPAGDKQDVAIAEITSQDMYLDTSTGSMDSVTYDGTITRAEAVYAIVQHFFASEYANLTGKESAYSDTKNAGNIAQKQGFAEQDKETKEWTYKTRYKAAELAYSIQNPEKGLPENLYKGMVVAKQVGLISGDESNWDNGLTKTEFLQILVNTFTAITARDGYVINAKYGNTGVAVAKPDESTDVAEISEETKQQVLEEYEQVQNLFEEDAKKAEETVAELEITSMDKTMYAKSSCNLRQGPGTEYLVIDSLEFAQQVHVVGSTKAADGKEWYQLQDADGSIVYVSASLLTDNKPEVTAPIQQTDPATNQTYEDNSPASTGESSSSGGSNSSGYTNIETGEPAKDGDIIGWGYDTEGNKYPSRIIIDDNWD